MSAHWADWIAVGVIVAVALTWLGIRMYRQWRKQKDRKPDAIGCEIGCENCPFNKNCTGRNQADPT